MGDAVGDAVGDEEPDAVEVRRDADPRRLADWADDVAAGRRLVLPAVPGAVHAVREALAFGVVALVDDPDDEEAVAAARRRVAGAVVSDADARALSRVLRHRSATEGDGRAAGSVADPPGTAPVVLALAFTRSELQRAPDAAALVQRWGGTLCVLTHDVVRRRPQDDPLGALTVVFHDPDSVLRWPELALVAHGGRQVARVGRVVTRAATRLPGPARSAVLGAWPAVERANDARVERGRVVHEKVWQPVQLRLRPYRVARAARPALSRLPVALDRVDLLVSAGPHAAAVSWHLLRRRPQIASRGSLVPAALVQVVQERTRRWADALD